MAYSASGDYIRFKPSLSPIINKKSFDKFDKQLMVGHSINDKPSNIVLI